MWLIKSVIIVVGVIAFIWVGMQNANQTVNFAFFTRTYEGLSLNLLLPVVFAAGMIFAFLIAVISEFQLRSVIGQQRRNNQRLEKELAALRNLPLEDGQATGNEPEITL